jgi:hypothetical protein
MLAIVACGKRGDPRPPVPVIPKAVSDLVVTQRADQVILSWTYPSLTTAGRSLTNIERITVFRYVEELPPSAITDPATPMPVDLDPALPRPAALFTKIPTLPAAQFAKLATRIESIEGANLGAATEGSKLLFTDRPPLLAIDGRPVRLTYAVVTEGESARSDFSNLAIMVPLAVAVPPAGVVAATRADGVVLSWEAPATSVRGYGDPVITGYNIYRNAPGEAQAEFPTPINTVPVTATTYTDTPAYGEHEYRVTAVATTGPPLVASEPSAPVKVTFADLVAPPVPASVTPLLEAQIVRLLWEPVAASDLAGYHVYRIEQLSRLRLTPHPWTETNFTDISLQLGITYHYEVTAIDKNGNESAAVKSEQIIVPKTP